MPAKNIVKEFAPDSYYHIYNRGVAKQKIFLDDQDYKTFLSYFKLYLTLPDLQDLQGPTLKVLKVSPSRVLKNFYEEIKLLAYCLLANHFHLFVFQKDMNGVTNFMRSLITKYSTYFNKKYKRVGPVFQGNYKGVMVKTENQFVYLSKYIHRNPLPLPTRSNLEGLSGYKYSSYINYLGLINQTWLDTSEILSYFSKFNTGRSYKKFVEEIDETDLIRIKDLMLDYEF